MTDRKSQKELVRAKIAQAQAALRQEGIDLWLIFLQETSVNHEPILDYLIGQGVTWQSAFLLPASGEAEALVGNFDVEAFRAAGCYPRVHGYTEGIAPLLQETLKRLNPATIALNYAADNPTADGLTHGLFLLLNGILEEIGMSGRVVPANVLVRRVRGQKTPEEQRRLGKAVKRTEEAFTQLLTEPLLDLTERQIAARIAELAARAQTRLAFPSIVNAGTKSALGHTEPTDALFEPGDLLHIDFGFRHEDYCADLQRCVYAPRPGESALPAPLVRAFDVVAETIERARADLRPGVRGCDVDAAAREFLRQEGFPEYAHALGHQLGRAVHDGGAILGPEWPRYGHSPRWPVEADQIFTLELEVTVPGVGYASLEEDVLVTGQGARWLSTPQKTPAILEA